MEFYKIRDRYISKSHFSSPSGTRNYTCSCCDLEVRSKEEVYKLTKPYEKNLELYKKNKRKYHKILKKLEPI